MPNLKHSEVRFLDEALGMESGYVLNFVNRTFSEFFADELGIDIDAEIYNELGTSKANRLRCFLRRESNGVAAKALRALWDHRMSQNTRQEDTEAVRQRYFAIITRLESDESLPRTDWIDRFERDPTIDELVAAIERDTAANKPEVALDRLHTYCMKKFAHLLRHGGRTCTRTTR